MNTKFKETGDSQYIYQMELDKACFQHEMAYGDFKDLTRRTASDIILTDKAFYTAKNPKYNLYHKSLASTFYKFFDKESTLFADNSTPGGAFKNKSMSNQELAEELHKPIIRKIENRKVYSPVIDNRYVIDKQI